MTSTKKQIRKSGAPGHISQAFIDNHMGNVEDAQKIALKRAGTIPKSHTVSLADLARINSEIKQRQEAGFHIDGNRVINPQNENEQFLTANSYSIFETKYDNRNRCKPTKEISRRFFYDVAGGKLHHFDGTE